MSRNHHYEPYQGKRYSEKEFFEFIYERQSIWHKKEILREGLPWTADKVLQKYLFCNVFRRQDRGTKHIIQSVCENKSLTLEEKIYNIILYRRFNVYGFFGEIVPRPLKVDEWDENGLIALFDSHRAAKKQIYSIAYNLCQVPFNKEFRRRDKHVQILLSCCDMVKRRFAAHFIEAHDLPFQAETIFEWLQFNHGVGKFLAYQIMQDISYIETGIVDGLNEFTYVGPGALGGLDILYGHHDKPAEQCRALWEMFKSYANEPEWDGIACGAKLGLGDMQSCLCEFRKWANLTNNPKKHKKRYYVPENQGV